jgi:hypothetical protein
VLPRWVAYLPVALLLLAVLFVTWLVIDDSEAEPDQRPRVLRIDGSQVIDAPSERDPELVLAGSSDLASGQLITTEPGPEAPEGFLLRVLSSDESDGRTTVEVEQASLFEAVPDGSLVAVPTDFSHYVEAPEHDYEQIQVHDGELVQTRLLTATPTPSPGHETLPFGLAVECEEGEKILLSGEFRTALEPRFDLRWGRRGSVRVASARVDGDVFSKLKASATREMSCDLRVPPLLTAQWIAFIPVGPVVVPVHFDLPIEISGSASFMGKAWASAQVDLDGSLGVEYSGGKVRPIRHFGYGPPELDAGIEATASTKVKAGPELTITAGWRLPALGGLAAKAGIGIYGGVDFNYDTTSEPPEQTCLPLELSGKIGFQASIRKKWKMWPIPIAKKNLKCWPPEPEAQPEH